MTYLESRSVDFTIPVGSDYKTIVVPLRLETEIWSIAHPFAYEVWLAATISLPLYAIMMGAVNYFFYGAFCWKEVFGFVIRNAFYEHSGLPDNRRAVQKLLIIIWVWCMFVLVQAYAGNLTALLALPRIPDPIRNAEEFLNQTEISLFMEKGNTEVFYFRESAKDSVQRKLFESATISGPLSYAERLQYGCFTEETFHTGRHAAVCWTGGIIALLSQDYSKNGHCNFYLTEDKFLTTMASIAAFQVRCEHCLKLLFISCVQQNFRKEALTWRMPILF